MNRIEQELNRAWDQEKFRAEYATPRQVFELGFCQGRVSGGADVGRSWIEAAEKAEKARVGDTQ